jgi:hypothetical protein
MDLGHIDHHGAVAKTLQRLELDGDQSGPAAA